MISGGPVITPDCPVLQLTPISLTIPLGVPVVPEVYKMYANSFDPISTQSLSFAFDKVRGIDVIIVIKAINKDHSLALLEKMNFPFIKKGDN